MTEKFMRMESQEQHQQERSRSEPEGAIRQALVELGSLFMRYQTQVENPSPGSSLEREEEVQSLFEQVEMRLRHLHRTMNREESKDPADGFFLDTRERIWIRFTDLIGEITTIFGMRGSGKSNSVAFLLEQLLRRGVPLSVIDLHGEYYSLRALPVPLLVVGITGGTASQPDLLVEPTAVDAVAAFSVEQGVSIILDLSGLKKRVRYQALSSYFEALWITCAKARRPYHLVLEEAHGYIPQQGSSPVEEVVSDLSTEYRKFGVGMVIIDQRPANVKKTPITQARVRILHEVDHPLDIERYRQLVPKQYAQRMDELLSSFVPGTALVKVQKRTEVIQVNSRQTVHIGITPSLEGSPTQIEVERDEHLVQQLREVLAAHVPRPNREETGLRPKREQDQTQLDEALQKVQALTQENRVLREQVAIPGTQGHKVDGHFPAQEERLAGTRTIAVRDATVEHVHFQGKDLLSHGERTDEAQTTFPIEHEQLRLTIQQQADELQRRQAIITDLREQLGRHSGQVPLMQRKNVPGLTPSQTRLVSLLIEDMNALSLFQRQLLTLLIQYEQEVPTQEIAARLKKTRASLANCRITQLSAMGLVKRTTRGYQSCLAHYCTTHLQRANVNLVRERLLLEIKR